VKGKFLFTLAIMTLVILAIGIISTTETDRLSAQNGKFKVMEVDKTSAALPGYMFYPRELAGHPEYGMSMMVWTVTDESQVYEWDACPGTDVHEAANWLRVLPQYVRLAWEGGEPIYIVSLPEPGWIWVQGGRLQYADGAELVTPDHDVARAYKIWTWNATWRCKSKFASPPPMPAKNIVFIDEGETPGNLNPAPQPTEQPAQGLTVSDVKKMCTNNCIHLKLSEVPGEPGAIKLAIVGTVYPTFKIPGNINWEDESGVHSGPANVDIGHATFRHN